MRRHPLSREHRALKPFLAFKTLAISTVPIDFSGRSVYAPDGSKRNNCEGLMLIRLSIGIAWVFISFGCATPPQVFNLDMPVVAPKDIQVLDRRPEEAKRFRTAPQRDTGTTEYWFGDDNFSPDRMTILRSGFQQRLGDKLSGRIITINSFEVRMFNPNSGIGENRLESGAAAAASVQGGFLATLLGTLLGGIIVDMTGDYRDERSIMCEIQGSSNGKSFWAKKVVRYPKAQMEAGVNEVIRETIGVATDTILKNLLPTQ
jgi:hypothetical protein